MSRPLRSPGGTYAVRLVIFAPLAPDGAVWRRHEVETGIPLAGAPPAEDHPPEGEAESPAEFLVAVPGVVSLHLRTRPAGLTIRNLRVEAPGAITLLARVTALAAGPEWLPDTADYALFHGDRKAAAALAPLHLPFPGGAAGDPPAGEGVAVDRLVAALGQSIARANARLARQRAEGGTALAASVTVRVAVSEFAVTGGGRVLLALPRKGEPATQHLEVTMTTVPAAEGDGGDP